MTQKLSFFKYIFLAFLLIASFFIIRKHSQSVLYYNYEGFIYGTTFHITYQSDKNMDDSIKATLDAVDQSLSMFNPQSTISKINQNKTDKTDLLFRNVYLLAHQVSQETNGCFDITVAPLVNLWGFGLKNKSQITNAVIDSVCKFVDYKKVYLSDHKILKQDRRIQLDCSAIAKGFGVDQVSKLFNRHNISNYMVEIGGEISVKGKNSKKQKWNIGINKPIETKEQIRQDLQIILQISDIAMATSGNYRRFYYKNGKKYAHTINPHTGYPVNHSLLSATVLAPSCALADAYATAFMVMGEKQSKCFLEHHPEIMAFFIMSGDDDKEYKTWASPALKKYILQ